MPLKLVEPSLKYGQCGGRVPVLSPLDLTLWHSTCIVCAHARFCTPLPFLLPASRQVHVVFMTPRPALPQSHPRPRLTLSASVYEPSARTWGREKRKYVTGLRAHSGSSFHKFPGSKGLFVFCPLASLLNISWDEPIYHL